MKKILKVDKSHKKDTSVVVSLPATIQIELVQGNELKHYEIFFLITSLTFSTAVSFWTSYATQPSTVVLFSALAFCALSLITGGIALYYRSKVYDKKIERVASLEGFVCK